MSKKNGQSPGGADCFFFCSFFCIHPRCGGVFFASFFFCYAKKRSGAKKKGAKKKGAKKKGEVESLKGLENAEERWLSGRKRLIANPLYELYSYRGFESLSLRNDLL